MTPLLVPTSLFAGKALLEGKTEAVLEKCLQLPLHPANSAQVQNVLGPNEDYRA